MLDYRLRPMVDKSWLDRGSHDLPTWRMSWDAMQDFMAAELDRIGGYDLAIDLDAPAGSLTSRGGVKRGGLVYSTAVVVSFETEDRGELSFPCDRYLLASRGERSTLATGWQSNVHAVAKHLEALRALERHGVAQGEQYDAYKALPSGSPAAVAAMSSEAAAVCLLAHAEWADGWPFLPADQKRVVKLARRRAHPDTNAGDRAKADEVDQAVQTLITAGVLPDGT